ncbi:FAD:protein FMN transferase [Bradyrhizobium sp. Ash2021]|uniref:FAD:protein FMN transferase n=1 Tax=Bradyrhizobium sp. Ash2021 TaxID=2954771 RepID=UPI002815B3DF|nr:FAD:protein FMN transferase [Bradyrhizobium sp. Ash2021]WMT73620.1 FAD:protein FMN transferase [Bradyrhizobium sp. Ash2021]
MAIDCGNIRRAKPLLGTFVEIQASGASRADVNAGIEAAFEAVAKVHRLMSFHEPDSDVSRLNQFASSHPVSVDPWTYEVLRIAIDLHFRSRGAFDITIAPVLQALGLLPGPDEGSRDVPQARTAHQVELLGDKMVRFSGPGIGIDLGGIAKGFAVDRALDALRGFGIANGLVNAGGDLAAFGPDPQAVSIRNPVDPQNFMCGIRIRNEALASSARRFDPFRSDETTNSAIIDPITSEPACAIQGTTVRAPTCVIADALTKIVMIAGTSAADLLEHYRAGALLVLADGDIQISSDLKDQVSLAA